MDKIKVTYGIFDTLAQISDIFQMRLLYWVLVKAQQSIGQCDMKLGSLNLSHALEVAEIDLPANFITTDKAHFREHIRRAFELQNKDFITQYEGQPVEIKAIAFPRLYKREKQWRIRYYVHRSLWLALLDFSRGWRNLNLTTLQTIKRPTTALIYFLIANQTAAKIYNLAQFRNYLRLTESYNKKSNFIDRILKPAQEELKTSDTNFSWRFQNAKRGTDEEQIIIEPHKQVGERSEPLCNAADEMQHDLPSEVRDYLEFNCGATPKDICTISRLIKPTDQPGEIIDRLARIKTAAHRAKAHNPVAYIVQSLKGKG